MEFINLDVIESAKLNFFLGILAGQKSVRRGDGTNSWIISERKKVDVFRNKKIFGKTS